MILGSIPDTFFLKTGDARLLKMLFGFVVVFIGAEMYFRERKNGLSDGSSVMMVIIGLLSGVLCGLFGVSALLVAYVSRTAENQSRFRANNCVILLLIVFGLSFILNNLI